VIRTGIAVVGGAWVLYAFRHLFLSGSMSRGGGSAAYLLIAGMVLIVHSRPWDRGDGSAYVGAMIKEVTGWGMMLMVTFWMFVASRSS
jgi:hypothetical protein